MLSRGRVWGGGGRGLEGVRRWRGDTTPPSRSRELRRRPLASPCFGLDASRRLSTPLDASRRLSTPRPRTVERTAGPRNRRACADQPPSAWPVRYRAASGGGPPLLLQLPFNHTCGKRRGLTTGPLPAAAARGTWERRDAEAESCGANCFRHFTLERTAGPRWHKIVRNIRYDLRVEHETGFGFAKARESSS